MALKPSPWRHQKSASTRSRATLSRFKFLTVAVVLTLYLVFFRSPGSPATAERPRLQLKQWELGGGHADEAKVAAVVKAMKHTFYGYRERAWGSDGVHPISGRRRDDRNGWGCFIIDSATTLALMELWTELKLSIKFILAIDFSQSLHGELVDPFETTIRYLGGLVSLVDLIDVGVVPADVATQADRDGILNQALFLAHKLSPAYDTPTGMPYPRVNFHTDKGERDPPKVYPEDSTKPHYDNLAIGPARAGSNILEHHVLSCLTSNPSFATTSWYAWKSLVWNTHPEPMPGLVDAPIDIMTGKPVGHTRHWDAGHDSYYEYLIKQAILAGPKGNTQSQIYADRWVEAALSLRANLSSRSAPAPVEYLQLEDGYKMQHQFIGRVQDGELVNSMSHLACFAPGNLILGGKYLSRPNLITFGQALLEGCRHTYNATASGIGPEEWGWTPSAFSARGFVEDRSGSVVQPTGPRVAEVRKAGFWVSDAKYKLRPEYVESLFYAWRITGEVRYREWAWEAFSAMERECRAEFGYASLADVRMSRRSAISSENEENGEERLSKRGNSHGGFLEDIITKAGDKEGGDEATLGQIDVEESFWAGETLKYLFLTFADVKVGSLDRFVYTTEAHPLSIVH